MGTPDTPVKCYQGQVDFTLQPAFAPWKKPERLRLRRPRDSPRSTALDVVRILTDACIRAQCYTRLHTPHFVHRLLTNESPFR
jgi:hypothetical protein